MNRKIIFGLVFLFCLNYLTVSASALTGATCLITAQVVGIEGGVEVEVLNTEIINDQGNCDFVNPGDVLKISDANNLNLNDLLEAGIEQTSAMTPEGDVVFGIHWEFVRKIDQEINDEEIEITSEDVVNQTEEIPSEQENKLPVMFSVLIIIVFVGMFYFFTREVK